jgi:DNA-binding ferritin-like protein
MSMLGYSSDSLFEWRQKTKKNQSNEKRISTIGKDIRELTQSNQNFQETLSQIQQLILKLGDEAIIDSNSKLTSLFNSKNNFCLIS